MTRIGRMIADYVSAQIRSIRVIRVLLNPFVMDG